MTTMIMLEPKAVDQLEPLLAAMVTEHERLLMLAGEHMAAISAADTDAIAGIVERTMASLRKIGEFEEARCRLLGLPMPRLGVRADNQPSIQALAEHIEDPDARLRVEGYALKLRELLAQIGRQHAVLARASESLVSHMQGLMKQLSAKLSHAGTYSRSACVEPGREQIITGIDLTR